MSTLALYECDRPPKSLVSWSLTALVFIWYSSACIGWSTGYTEETDRWFGCSESQRETHPHPDTPLYICSLVHNIFFTPFYLRFQILKVNCMLPHIALTDSHSVMKNLPSISCSLLFTLSNMVQSDDSAKCPKSHNTAHYRVNGVCREK